MHILDFTPELLSHILHFCILNRGFKRALRLKLVCKSFYQVIIPLVFHTKALDEAGCYRNFVYWHCRTYYGSEILWHDYLVFRCRNETDKSVGRFVEIRDVAHAILQHSDQQSRNLDLNVVIDSLCWLALERGTQYPGTRKRWASTRNPKPPNPDLNLLSAGTYFGCVLLVRDLINQGCDPRQDGDLFPAPIYLAAWTGQTDMLQLMQKYLPHMNDPSLNAPTAQFLSALGHPSLIGAVIRGDVDMVRLVLESLSRSIPLSDIEDDGNDSHKVNEYESKDTSSPLDTGLQSGSVREGTSLWKYIRNGMRSARSPEVYQYLMSFLKVTNTDQDLQDKSNELAQRAGWGDIVMVRYLLGLGADPAFKDADGGPALCQATRGFHNDIANLLLELGADPNETGRHYETPLMSAAKAGNMAMVIKLLDFGAVLKKYPMENDTTLMHAVKLEHTAMVELLLPMGGGVMPRQGKLLLHMAENEGLESMAAILEPWVARAAADSFLLEP